MDLKESIINAIETLTGGSFLHYSRSLRMIRKLLSGS